MSFVSTPGAPTLNGVFWRRGVSISVSKRRNFQRAWNERGVAVDRVSEIHTGGISAVVGDVDVVSDRLTRRSLAVQSGSGNESTFVAEISGTRREQRGAAGQRQARLRGPGRFEEELGEA